MYFPPAKYQQKWGGRFKMERGYFSGSNLLNDKAKSFHKSNAYVTIE